MRNKLLKIKENSPVFNLDKSVLIGLVRNVNNKLKISISDDGKFDVVSIDKAKVFLRIMDDDYVKSILTGNLYEAEKKNEMND